MIAQSHIEEMVDLMGDDLEAFKAFLDRFDSCRRQSHEALERLRLYAPERYRICKVTEDILRENRQSIQEAVIRSARIIDRYLKTVAG